MIGRRYEVKELNRLYDKNRELNLSNLWLDGLEKTRL